MELIETIELGSSAASIEFTSIPQDGTDLLLVTSVRSTYAADEDYLTIEPNGSVTNFTGRRLEGYGSGVQTNSFAQEYYGFCPGANTTSNTFSNDAIYIPNYASVASAKQFSADSVSENNATRAWQVIAALNKSDAGAITSITVGLLVGNLVAGSTASLYKITKA